MHELPMQLRVNGEVRQQGNTNQTRIKFPHLVAYHSPQIYSAGDIITTGTISGVAAVQPEPVRLLPEARRPDRGRDHRHRHAPQPGHQLGGRATASRPRSGSTGEAREPRRPRRPRHASDGAVDVDARVGRPLRPRPAGAVRRLGGVRASGPCGVDGCRGCRGIRSRSIVGELGAPVPRPRQVFAIGLNYAEHAAEAGYPPDSMPVTFTKFPSCIVGPGRRRSRCPRATSTGRSSSSSSSAARRTSVDRESAWDHVAGLTIGQDLSERITQLQGSAPQFSLGKSFPGFGPTGPWLVTPDEFADRDDLAISCSLVGRGHAVLAHVDDALRRAASCSCACRRSCPLLPGDIIFSGTPSGIGNRRTPPALHRPGRCAGERDRGHRHADDAVRLESAR